MRRVLPLLFVVIAATAWCQIAIPGTFNTQSPQTTTAIVGGPIISPPVIHFGSDVNPPVVVNRSTVVVTAPNTVAIEPSMVGFSQSPSLPGMVNTGGSRMSAPNTYPAGHIEYVIAPSSGAYGAPSVSRMGDTALGQLAAGMRKGPTLAQRSFTNEDIARMNSVTNTNYQMPGANAPVSPYDATTGNVPNARLSEQNRRTTEMARLTPPQQPGAETAPTQPTPPQQGATQEPPSSTQSKRLPSTSSLLPLLAALGTLAAGAGAVFARSFGKR